LGQSSLAKKKKGKTEGGGVKEGGERPFSVLGSVNTRWRGGDTKRGKQSTVMKSPGIDIRHKKKKGTAGAKTWPSPGKKEQRTRKGGSGGGKTKQRKNQKGKAGKNNGNQKGSNLSSRKEENRKKESPKNNEDVFGHRHIKTTLGGAPLLNCGTQGGQKKKGKKTV